MLPLENSSLTTQQSQTLQGIQARTFLTKYSKCSALREDLLVLAYLYHLQSAAQLCVVYMLLIWLMKLETACTIISLSPLQKVGEKQMQAKTNFLSPKDVWSQG